jgi:hypothetical protein
VPDIRFSWKAAQSQCLAEVYESRMLGSLDTLRRRGLPARCRSAKEHDKGTRTANEIRL